jgi:hypothetical protein
VDNLGYYITNAIFINPMSVIALPLMGRYFYIKEIDNNEQIVIGSVGNNLDRPLYLIDENGEQVKINEFNSEKEVEELNQNAKNFRIYTIDKSIQLAPNELSGKIEIPRKLEEQITKYNSKINLLYSDGEIEYRINNFQAGVILKGSKLDEDDLDPECVDYIPNEHTMTYNSKTVQDILVKLLSEPGVTEILPANFIDMKIEQIEIPDNILTIGEGAFSDNSELENVTFGKNIISIDRGAFQGCKNLKSVKLNQNLRIIGAFTFSGCRSLKDINLTNSIEYILTDAFRGCRGIKELIIPNSVKTIASGAFMKCSSLENIEIPKSVETFGREVFKGCTKLKHLKIPQGLLERNNKTEADLFGDTAIWSKPKSCEIGYY